MKKLSFLLLTAAIGASLLSPAFAQEPKKVIVVSVTLGFRHSSIALAEKAIEQIAQESKAFKVVDFVRQPTNTPSLKPVKPKDLKPNADEKAKARYEEDLKKYEEKMAAWTPADEEKDLNARGSFDRQMKEGMAKLSPEALTAQKIDGVIFVNTTGELPLPDREGFIKWIEAGHAFMAMHSASDTLHKFPGYSDMLQGEFAGHGAQVPADLVAADVAHPANGGIGETWELKQEEMYLIKGHDRSKVRSLWHLRHHPNKPAETGYFPVSWCRIAGTGKVFYTSLGHREDLWSADPALPGRLNSVETSQKFHAHILGGIQWALGLKPGSAEPNPSAP